MVLSIIEKDNGHSWTNTVRALTWKVSFAISGTRSTGRSNTFAHVPVV